MSLRPRAEETYDSFFQRFEAWSSKLYQSIQRNKPVEKDDPDGSIFNVVSCTFGTEQPNSHINMKDGRSWNEYFAGFKKWSEDYYRFLEMKNRVPERSAQDTLIGDSSGTERFEIPFQTNGFILQSEEPVREEMFRHSFPQSDSVYCFPNMKTFSQPYNYFWKQPNVPQYNPGILPSFHLVGTTLFPKWTPPKTTIGIPVH
ncbi:hypothetical protein TNIN_374361 [Trichonephila inaurata madagascariensis]|uniref:Uncharacterized protein n=1 Tax=Trichonephila inaurata madagascariensis TaxID=2747483 RepID=A0A8X7BSW9_9ARAC|nr:hypothetical protein TNIN_374361 [Trichonephila inaurata madagascariensis]